MDLFMWPRSVTLVGEYTEELGRRKVAQFTHRIGKDDRATGKQKINAVPSLSQS